MKSVATLLKRSIYARATLALFAITAVGGAVFLLLLPTPEERLQKALEEKVVLSDEEKKLVSARLEELSGDADSDGLKDWEELIYKTDKDNPDTDGDGAKDGEEVRAGRNPLKTGPNDDILGTLSDETAKESADAARPISNKIADILLQDQAFAAALTNGPESLTDEDVARLAERVYAARPNIGESVDSAALWHPIKIITDNSPLAIKNYFNALGAILIKYLSGPAEEDSLAIIERALAKNNLAELYALNSKVELLDRSIAALQNVPTPSSLVDFQKKELLLFAKTKNELAALAKAEEDPAVMIFLVPEVLKLKKEAGNFHRELIARLAGRSIMFSNEEGGVFFNKEQG